MDTIETQALAQGMLFDPNAVRQIDGNYYVVKENTIIRSSYDLNLYEHRVVAVVASQIRPTDQPGQNYFFRVKDFAGYFGLNNDNIHTVLKDTLVSLRSKTFIIKRPNEKERITGWINWAEIVPSTGCVEISIDDRIRPYFLNIKAILGYTKYQLKYIKNLQNPYSFRYYERFKSELKDKTYVEVYLEIDELKKWLSIESQYKAYADLKKRVIVTPLEDINGEKFPSTKAKKTTKPKVRKRKPKENLPSDIRVEFKENKPGRKVLGIWFCVTQVVTDDFTETIDVDAQPSPPVPALEVTLTKAEQEAFDAFVEITKNEAAVVQAVQDFGANNLKYLLATFKKNEPTDPKSYAFSILKNGWGIPKERLKKPEPAPENNDNNSPTILEMTNKYLDDLSDYDRDELLHQFKAHIDANYDKKSAMYQFVKFDDILKPGDNPTKSIFRQYLFEEVLNKQPV